jgi:RNA polymerase sigma-70 factor (ECF subfamily)
MDIPNVIFNGCLKRDSKSQESLYHFVYPHLMRIALRYVINESDAQEIINKGLYKVLIKIEDFDGTYQNFGGWIKRIIINESIDWIRSKKAFNQKHMTVGFIADLSYEYNEIDNNPEYILNLLDALPLKTRTVFNLFVIEGYSHKEISELLAMKENNSKWHLHAAKKQLKEWLIKKELY